MAIIIDGSPSTGTGSAFSFNHTVGQPLRFITQDTASFSTYAGFSSGTNGVGQIFTTGSNQAYITSIQCKIYNNGGGNFIVQLKTGTDPMGGTTLASKTQAVGNGWQVFTFDSPVAVTPSTQYCYRLSTDGGTANVEYSSTDVYAGGYMWHNGSYLYSSDSQFRVDGQYNMYNRVLVVTSMHNSCYITGGIQYNGVAMSQLIDQGGTRRAAIFYLVNPPIGTYSVTVGSLLCGGSARCSAMSLFNISQSSPVNTYAQIAGQYLTNSGTLNVTTTGSGEKMLIDIWNIEGSAPTSFGASQTAYGQSYGSYKLQASSGADSMSYNRTGIYEVSGGVVALQEDSTPPTLLNVKSIIGLATTNVKSINGVAKASTKSYNGLA